MPRAAPTAKKPRRRRRSASVLLETTIGGVPAWVREGGEHLWGISCQRDKAARMTEDEALELQAQLFFKTTVVEA